ncbi:MAG: OmpH family outer membrane protein [Kordia sp.]|uniref:OmpH family outer membrane protein n=1 Tax=Kordia sp. TaxID=1965332 RepID=UPI003858782A
MKTKVLFLLTMLLTLSTVNAQKRVGAKVGYIDMEYILENVTAYQEANTQLEAKAQRWKNEIQKKQNAIDQMKKNLSAERVLLTKELVDEREEEIEILEQELQTYQQDRFGPFGSLMAQRQNMVKPIQDQVLTAVQDIAKKKRYDFVFDKSADVVMLFSSKKFDISDQVLRVINRDEKRKGREDKLRKKQSDTSKFEDADTVNEPNPEVEAKKKAAAEKKAERQKILDERKVKREADREAKKKAYEEKRKKLVEAREAKKKAAEEKRKKREEDRRKKAEERKKQQEEKSKEKEENGEGAGNGK